MGSSADALTSPTCKGLCISQSACSLTQRSNVMQAQAAARLSHLGHVLCYVGVVLEVAAQLLGACSQRLCHLLQLCLRGACKDGRTGVAGHGHNVARRHKLPMLARMLPCKGKCSPGFLAAWTYWAACAAHAALTPVPRTAAPDLSAAQSSWLFPLPRSASALVPAPWGPL